MIILICKNCKSKFLSVRRKRSFCSHNCVGQYYASKKIIDLRNKKFGFLLTLKKTQKRKDRCVIWLCKCICGNLCEKSSRDLISGKVVSCGCYQKLVVKQTMTKHGELSNWRKNGIPRLYSIWVDMRKRCNNSKNKAYKYYGLKEISVCKEWNNYSKFKKWALNNGYKTNLTIDRINPKGDYSPKNCQWITHSENARKAQLQRYSTRGF